MKDFVVRNTPKIAEAFDFRLCPDKNGCDTYEVFSEDKKIIICGSNKIAMAMGYYRYLHDFCNVLLVNGDYDISYIKNAPLPDKKLTFTVPQKIRMAMTNERYAAEADAWGFDRWEKEIDFMAMNGVNTPLALTGSDGVLFKMLTEMRIKPETVSSFISGSSYWYRQLTGNIFGFLPVNSTAYYERKIAIGKMVTEREKELDMNPVHQGLMLTVPFSFRRHYPKTDLIKLPPWNAFPPAMTIAADDYGYLRIFNKNYLELQKELLGEVHNYIFDPLTDVDTKGYNSFIEEIGEDFRELLDEIDSEGIWFVRSGSLPVIKEKIQKTVIIDEDGGDYISRGGFEGSDFVVGFRGNLNGRTVLCGDMETLSGNPYLEAKEKYTNAVGTGLFFDSDDENPMFYTLAAKMLTSSEKADLNAFITDFSRCRYGSERFAGDLKKLVKLCYRKGSSLNQASALCARPCTQIKHTAPLDTFERPYENKDLLAFVKSSVASDDKKNDSYRKDMSSVLRQALSNVLRPLHEQATKCFFNQMIVEYEKTSNVFVEICEDIDRLLRTVPKNNLYHHLESARQLGDTKELRQNLEINFLMYHTIYGPVKHSRLFDTNWREWGGMVGHFYTNRWYKYYKMLAAYFDKPKKLKDISRHQFYERNAFSDTLLSKRLEYFETEWIRDYVPRPTGIGEEDTVDVMNELIEKYENVINEF